MSEYLQLRGSTYYFRRPIPKNLSAVLTAEERRAFHFSLETKDKADAKRKRTPAIARTDELLQQASARPKAPASLEAEPARALTEEQKRALELQDIWEQENVAWCAEQSAADDAWVEETDELEARFGYVMHADRFALADHEKLIRSLMEVVKDHKRWSENDRQVIVRLHAQNDRAELKPAQAQGQVQEPRSSETRTVQGQINLHCLVDRWAGEGRKAHRTVDEHKSIVRRFQAVAGDKPVDQYTRLDCLNFKDALLNQKVSPGRINVLLRKLGTIFLWGVRNGFAAGNPAHGVRILHRGVTARSNRRPYELEDLIRLLAHPVFHGAPIPRRGRGSAAFWLPLLAIFTGARREELGQLKVADVANRSYAQPDGTSGSAWFINITDASEDQHLKTAQSARRVPIHREIIRLGFIDYVSGLKTVGEAQLFPRLTQHADGSRTAKWGEWFSNLLRNECGLSDRRLVFHSFRHLFKFVAGECGISERVQRQLMGHSSGDVADKYGGPVSDFLLVEAINQFRIPGLDLGDLVSPA